MVASVLFRSPVSSKWVQTGIVEGGRNRVCLIREDKKIFGLLHLDSES